MRVLTLHDDEAFINYAQPIVAELRENRVRVDADFGATRFKTKVSNAEVSRASLLFASSAAARHRQPRHGSRR